MRLRAHADLTCALPWDDWCTEPGFVRQKLDCGDGDGIDDWACTKPALGQRGVLLSSDCDSGDHWPDAAAALCPPLFNRESGSCMGGLLHGLLHGLLQTANQPGSESTVVDGH